MIQCGMATREEKRKFAIKCENNIPIRYHYDQTEGFVSEKGPVILPDKMACKNAEGLKEDEIIKFKRDGYWISYYDGIRKLSEGNNKNNKKVGKWRYYNKEGKLTKEENYEDGKKEGEEKGYFTDGSIRYEGQNKNGKKVGIWKEYSDPRKTCVTEGEYNDNMKTGEWKECSMDENTKKYYISFRGSYYQNLKDGPAETYFPDGTIASKGMYKANLKCKENPPSEGESACGKKIGKWVFYYNNGKIMEEGNYDQDKGVRIGLWKEFYQTGEIRAQGNREHTKVGLWTFYDKKGNIIGQYQFSKNDFMASYCVEFENGKKVKEGPCTAKLIKYEAETDSYKITGGMQTGKWKGYHSNGKLAWEGELMMGKKQGQWKHYDENGKLVAEGEYKMNKKTGIWKEMIDGKLVTKEYDAFGREKK